MNQPLVIACGALAADLRAVLGVNGLEDQIQVTYLPANLHNRPERIVPEIEPLLEAAIDSGREVFVAYADCGTGGRLDALLQRFPSVQRLPGAHCYEFFAGADQFAELHLAEPGTFYLTDFLAKHFQALVWQSLGLDRAPQLRDAYFGNYTRVVLLSQTDDEFIVANAKAAAAQLGLVFEHRHVGRNAIAQPIVDWSVSVRKVAA
jgi:hypothetical protein